jgi:hypothetical protein
MGIETLDIAKIAMTQIQIVNVLITLSALFAGLA